jgi:hypothetical protein
MIDYFIFTCVYLYFKKIKILILFNSKMDDGYFKWSDELQDIEEDK